MASDRDEYEDDAFAGSGDEVQKRRLVISIDFGTTYTGRSKEACLLNRY
jgi:hypothetical protein